MFDFGHPGFESGSSKSEHPSSVLVIAFDVLVQLFSEQDAIKGIYTQARRIGSTAAVKPVASVWASIALRLIDYHSLTLK